MPIRKAVAVWALLPILMLAGGANVFAASTPGVSKHAQVFSGTITDVYASPNATNFSVYLAQQLGIWTKYGLTVNVELVASTALDAALESGAVTFVTIPPPQLELAYQTGVPIQLIGIASEHDTASILIGAPGVNGLKGLVGKSVGVGANTSISSIFPKYALINAGISPKTVETVAATSPSAETGFLAGEYDAYLGNTSTLANDQRARPGTTALFRFKYLFWPSIDIWGYSPWMTSHTAETAAFLRAYNKSLVAWFNPVNRTLDDSIISKYANTTSQSVITGDYQVTVLDLNHNGSQLVHSPSTKIAATVNKVLRQAGVPTAYNSYADEGREWTAKYWNLAFPAKS